MITQYFLKQLKKMTYQWGQMNAALDYSGKRPRDSCQQNPIDLDFFCYFLFHVLKP